jgi:hypothetical protein
VAAEYKQSGLDAKWKAGLTARVQAVK